MFCSYNSAQTTSWYRLCVCETDIKNKFSRKLTTWQTPLASPATGHRGTSPPIDFQQFNFFLNFFRSLQSCTNFGIRLHVVSCLLKNIQADSLVTVYSINFIILLCVTRKLFSLSFVPPSNTRSWLRHWEIKSSQVAFNKSNDNHTACTYTYKPNKKVIVKNTMSREIHTYTVLSWYTQ